MLQPSDSQKFSSCYRVLTISELAQRICDFSNRGTWVNLLYLSRRTFACIAPIVWKDVNLKPILLLIPEVEFSEIDANQRGLDKAECGFSFPRTFDLTRFKLYADFVRVARVHVPHRLYFCGQDLGAALQRPPLPNLRRLILNTYGPANILAFSWVSGLLTPSLLGLEFQSIHLKESGGEDTRLSHSWIELEGYFELIGQMSRKCPHLETLRIFPGVPSSWRIAVNGTKYNGITSLKHLRTLALGVIEIDQELFLALVQLPCLETLSLHTDVSWPMKTKNDRIDIPDDSFLTLRHLALYGLSDSSIQVICTLPSLFRHLVKASFIFPGYSSLKISKQRDFSLMIVQCLERSPHLADLTVLSSRDNSCLSLYPPVVLDILRHLPLRRLRLDRARLRSWGDADQLDNDDRSVDEDTGHVEIQWRDFFVAVPHLEELHLDLQPIMSYHLPIFASALPNVKLLTLMGVVLEEEEEISADRAATQPITIRCPFYLDDQDQDEMTDPSRVTRYMYSIWPNARLEIKESLSWVHGEPPDEVIEIVARFSEAIEHLRPGSN
ncbi:hypothetical protein FRC08_005015 [Ceratobasidium sp. 394]|nr:hypothetical protein FRC08_005015 [Ceratobasidium sp. 394]